MADMQTVNLKYFNLVGNEDDIGSERPKWSRASTACQPSPTGDVVIQDKSCQREIKLQIRAMFLAT